AETLLLETGPCLGVVDLSHDDFSLQAIASLVNRHKQVRWLALVRDEQLGIESVCQFIVSFCIDYFTSPLPESQLLKTLGHQRGML
ncbi:VpsR-related response regulator, partial [Photobacterium sp. R1]